MLHFGEYLRQARLSQGLTMQELAERLEVSPQFISLLESTKRHPSDKLVQRAARLFEEDLNYLRFLAQPIPEAQKRALFESPSAPDYIPQSMRTNIMVQDTDDTLMEALLRAPALPGPEEDTIYHFAVDVAVADADLAVPRSLIDQVRNDPERFPLKMQAWADFYEAYYDRHANGRVAAQDGFAKLCDRMQTETGEAYPQRLRYLAVLHHALCHDEAGDAGSARRLYTQALEYAAAVDDPAGQACALWHISALDRAEGDTIRMIETLHKALRIKDIPPFALARCRTDAVTGYLALWRNEDVIAGANETIKLWRSSTLPGPQDDKSLCLIQMEVSAFEAALRMDREEEARNWLSRVRSMRVRIELPDLQEGQLSAATGTLLIGRDRLTQAKKHPNAALRLTLPEDDDGNHLRVTCQRLLADIAVLERRLVDAEALLRDTERTPVLNSAVRELDRQGQVAFAWVGLQRAQDNADAVSETLDGLEETIKSVVADDKRIGDTPLVAHLYERIGEMRDAAAA